MFFQKSLQNDEYMKAKLDFSLIMGCCWSCEDRSGFDQDSWNHVPEVVLLEMIPSPHFGTSEKEDIAGELKDGSDEKSLNDVGSEEKESHKEGEVTAIRGYQSNEIKDNEKAFEKTSDNKDGKNGNTDGVSSASSFNPNHDIAKEEDDKTLDDKSSFEQSVAKATIIEIEANGRRSEEDKDNETATIADDKYHEDGEGNLTDTKRLWQ